jgi:CxxC motif-containing protein (DUF1111 family)
MARIPRARAGLVLALLLGLAGCETYDDMVVYLLPDLVALPVGAFEQPAVAPSGFSRGQFLAGHQAFVAACGACHRGDGRAAPAVADGGLTETAILRLSPPDPNYGVWIDHRPGPDSPAEVRVAVAYQLLAGRFPDGEAYELRLPRHELSDFAAGPLAEGTSVSPRAAPPVIGAGLVAAIEEAALRARADPDDRDGDGISGRLGQGGLKDGAAGPGRFGWKATAAGFVHDAMATPAETDALAGYLERLGAPPRRNLDDPLVRRGGAVFATAGCPACHLPRAVAGAGAGLGAGASGAMPEMVFYPYSDFLLHDMGKGLADAGDGAMAREWRSAPLWGLGQELGGLGQELDQGGSDGREPGQPGGATYLHDGRARNLMEAILWHGGEARAARKNARALSKEDRAALIAFLESL